MFSPNMNMRPYIGDESGIQLVPEPSRFIGSARLIVECISICISWPPCEGGCIFSCSCSPALWVVAATEGEWRGRLGSIAPTLDVERWALDVRRFFSPIGTSFIPHFGQFPARSVMTSGCIGQVYFWLFSCCCS